jgi:hypothetical protein
MIWLHKSGECSAFSPRRRSLRKKADQGRHEFVKDATLEVQARESSDNPRLNAFCRVAPSVRFKALAIFAAGVFFRAADFSSRTSAAVHERRFEFLAI